MRPALQKAFIFIGVLLLLTLIGWIDWATGAHVNVLALYAVPIFLAVWWVGSLPGLLIVLLSAAYCYIIRPHERGATPLPEGVRMWNGLMRLVSLTFYWIGSAAVRFKIETLHRRVRMLTGILPVCGSCKKIRDEQGYWNDIEIYLKEHSEANVAQKLCPDCSRRLSAGKISEPPQPPQPAGKPAEAQTPGPAAAR